MNKHLSQKLKTLPITPGVYFHKNSSGEIIYIGKAANLRNRVRQYFHKSRLRDPKTDALVAEIADIEWMEVDSELEALFLEAEMVRRYLPRYNILLRDDKSLVYIRISYDDEYPTVTTTRHPLDDGGRYFGPYLSALSVGQALKVLRRAFPFATKRMIGQKRASLHYHIGLDPGLEEGKTSLTEYRANLRKLMAVIEGKQQKIEKELENDLKQFANNLQFEEAAKTRNQLFALKRLKQQVIFSDKEFQDIHKDHALTELTVMLGLSTTLGRIEGYDVSHMQGSDVVASMVVFTNGVSDRTAYRKFKTYKNQNNDFANMNEIIMRRFSTRHQKDWGVPNLVIIDGGKGQLQAAIEARNATGITIPFIGLAKREEQIVIHNHSSGVHLHEATVRKLSGYVEQSDDFTLINLPHHTNIIKLLQRIRDESHRFAVSYHSTLKRKRQVASVLDDISGVGPAKKKKLLRAFGSVRGVTQADESDIAVIVGARLARTIKQAL